MAGTLRINGTTDRSQAAARFGNFSDRMSSTFLSIHSVLLLSVFFSIRCAYACTAGERVSSSLIHLRRMLYVPT